MTEKNLTNWKKNLEKKLRIAKVKKSYLMYQKSTQNLIRFHRLQDKIKCIERN